MKTSLKFILLLAGMIVLAAPVLRAQDSATPPADKPNRPERGQGQRGPGAMMERIGQELGLTADQQAKWKEIGQQERTALQAIRNDSALSQKEKRAKAMEANKPFAGQRRAVLNPDQQVKFDELRAKINERGPRGPKPDKPAGN